MTRRREGLDARYEEVFLTIGRLLCVRAEHLHLMHFADGWAPSRTGGVRLAERQGVSDRALRKRLSRLVDLGLLARVAFHRPPPPGAPNRRSATYSLFQLTDAGRRRWSRVAGLVPPEAARPLSRELVAYGWLRSSLWAALIRKGWRVGRSGTAVAHLRRFILDRTPDPHVANLVRATLPALVVAPGADGKPALVEEPYACSTCGYRGARVDGTHAAPAGGSCRGALQAFEYVPFDIAYRNRGGFEAGIVLVDDPRLPVAEQMKLLPIFTPGQAVVPVLVRPSDESSFDERDGRWMALGARGTQLVQAIDGAAGVGVWNAVLGLQLRDALPAATSGTCQPGREA